MVFDMSVRHEEKANVIRITGDLSNETVGQLQSLVNRLMNENEKAFIFDLSLLDFIDSKGAGTFLQLKRQTTGKRTIALAAVNSNIKNVLTRLMIADQFRFYSSVDEAISRV